MQAFEIADLIAKRKDKGSLWHEFLRSDELFCGIYALAAGTDDPQTPHATDEVYYTISGRATIHVAGEDRPVNQGSVIYVKAGDDHRFHSITEDLTLLVFFTTPSSS